MTIVRYTNKKTGVVSLYESTSHYDPETKQSRPIRKYLGREDPVTGELIPSSGKRGRKKGSETKETPDWEVTRLKADLERKLMERDAVIKTQAAEIKRLQAEKDAVKKQLEIILRGLTV